MLASDGNLYELAQRLHIEKNPPTHTDSFNPNLYQYFAAGWQRAEVDIAVESNLTGLDDQPSRSSRHLGGQYPLGD